MVERAQVRAIIGGQAFLHRGSLALLIPSSLLTSLLARGITSIGPLAGWTAANVVAFACCWALVELADRTVFRRRAERPVPIAAVVSFGGLLGAVKGAATDLAGAGLGLGMPTVSALGWRSLGTAALGAVAVPALAALHVAVERSRTEHAILVAQQLHDLSGRGDASATEGPTVLRVLAEDLRRELATVPAHDAPVVIRRLLDERLRPMMEALWAEGERPPSRLDVASLLRLALVRNPLPVVGITLAYTVSILPRSIELTGAAMGGLRSLVAGLTLALTLLIARGLRPSGGAAWAGSVHLVITVGAATAVQMLQWDRLLGGMPLPSSPALWGTVAVWIGVLVLVGGAVAIALRDRSLVRAELLRVLGPEVLRDVALRDHDRLLAQRVATRLHADVQGRMLAAARRIEGGAHDPDVVGQELLALDALLRELPGIGDVARATPLGERLEDLVRRWQGFIAVRFDPSIADVAAALDARSEVDDRVVQIISEAVVNAARHGLAAAATVRIEGGEGGVVVTVLDDGIGPRDGAPGLGSAYFSSASGGDWSLTAAAHGGTVLRVRLVD
jgi:hypothetical protein